MRRTNASAVMLGATSVPVAPAVVGWFGLGQPQHQVAQACAGVPAGRGLAPPAMYGPQARALQHPVRAAQRMLCAPRARLVTSDALRRANSEQAAVSAPWTVLAESDPRGATGGRETLSTFYGFCFTRQLCSMDALLAPIRAPSRRTSMATKAWRRRTCRGAQNACLLGPLGGSATRDDVQGMAQVWRAA